MESVIEKNNLYRDNLKVIKKTKDKVIYKVKCLDGDGEIICHHVFPGIDIIYNNFNTFHCFEPENISRDIIEINHCRKGRFECKVENDSYISWRRRFRGEQLSDTKRNFWFPSWIL